MTTERSTYDPSPEVLRILDRRYKQRYIRSDESSTGRGYDEVTLPPPDLLAKAVAAGVMFTEPRVLDHDGWISAARQAAAGLTAREVGDAFLASLTSGRMDLRSALASYALTHNLPEHSFRERHNWSCAVCGMPPDRADRAEDPNSWNQSRFGWAGSLRDDIKYAAFDLEQFARAPLLEPADADLAIGQQLIDHLRQLPPKTTAAQAARSLAMIPGTKSQREVLFEILGTCGILHSPGHPGYNEEFIPHTQSVDFPSQRFPFGSYPTWWWKAEGGINSSALAKFLPQLH